MRPTTVISVRGRDRLALQADPYFIYVGRSVPRLGWKGSIWGNPHKINHLACGRQDAVARFFEDLTDALQGRAAIGESFREMARRLPDLRGKTLGCYCCDWRPGEPIVTPCHAIVIAKLADGLEGGDH
jgi:hypothetical protein